MIENIDKIAIMAGDKIKCIDAVGYKRKITEGKEYLVLSVNNNTQVLITSDDNTFNSFSVFRFKVVIE